MDSIRAVSNLNSQKHLRHECSSCWLPCWLIRACCRMPCPCLHSGAKARLCLHAPQVGLPRTTSGGAADGPQRSPGVRCSTGTAACSPASRHSGQVGVHCNLHGLEAHVHCRNTRIPALACLWCSLRKWLVSLPSPQSGDCPAAPESVPGFQCAAPTSRGGLEAALRPLGEHSGWSVDCTCCRWCAGQLCGRRRARLQSLTNCRHCS